MADQYSHEERSWQLVTGSTKASHVTVPVVHCVPTYRQRERVFRFGPEPVRVSWYNSFSRRPAYVSEFQGVVERCIRSVSELTRVIHIQSKLPRRFHPYAVTTAVAIYNTRPNSTLLAR